MKDYIKQVLRTEAPITSELLKRLIAEADALVGPSALLGLSESLGDTANAYKKHIFYGAALERVVGRGGAVPAAVNARLLGNVRALHALLGLMSEVGELGDAYLRHIAQGDVLDRTNVIEEVGDVCWYLGLLLHTLGADFDEVQHRNIAKLRARYPEKFTEQCAEVRDLAAERRALEDVPADRPEDN